MSSCAQCNAPLNPNSKFCGKCGAKAEQIVSPPSQARPSVPIEVAKERVTAPPSPIGLIACPACQKTVSSQAVACPHCGQPLTSPQHQSPISSTSSAFLPNQSQLLSSPSQTAEKKAAEYRAVVNFGVVSVVVSLVMIIIGIVVAVLSR
jgi:uncharacterized membrane protein YvbJ